MPAGLVLWDRDLEILKVLSRKVLFLSLRQVADTFFEGDAANAVRRLESLEEQGFLVSSRLNARTPPPIDRPLATWIPGEDQPNPSRIAFQLRKRWLRQESRMRLCYFAGKRFEAISGIPCAGKPIRKMQASHDLGLGSLYLHFRSERMADGEKWNGEFTYTCFEATGQRPDAVLLGPSGSPEKAIEYGGIYSTKRIDRFHHWCQARSLPYELW